MNQSSHIYRFLVRHMPRRSPMSCGEHTFPDSDVAFVILLVLVAFQRLIMESDDA
jgi:hypothetical protein